MNKLSIQSIQFATITLLFSTLVLLSCRSDKKDVSNSNEPKESLVTYYEEGYPNMSDEIF